MPRSKHIPIGVLVALGLVAPVPAARAAQATLASVESDPHFAAWAASLALETAPALPGCATTETLGDEQLQRHRLREELLSSLAERGISPAPPPAGVAPWPWADVVAPAPAIALVDSGDTAILVDAGTITYTNQNGQPEVDPFHAAQAFYAGHNDEYDFLVVFTNFYTQLAGGGFQAYHQAIANDATGLGYVYVRQAEIFNDAMLYTRKPQAGRLQSFVHLNDVRRYPVDPEQKLDDHYTAVTLLGHEMAHRWLARVRLEVPGGGPTPILLGRQSTHWSFFFNSGPSPLEGNAWSAEATGFRTQDLPLAYGPLDLYLMGMIGAEEVGPGALWYLNAPSNFDPPNDARGGAWSRGSRPTAGVACQGQRVEFSVQDVTLANGLRLPAYPDTRRDLKVAFALVVRDLSTVTPEQLETVANLRAAFPAWFHAGTLGRGNADTHLTHVPARIVFTHRRHGNVEDPTAPIAFEARVRLEQWSLPTRLEDIRVSLVWSVDGGAWTETPMSSPALGEFAATIPPQPLGSTVRYSLHAASNFPGHVQNLPETAPDSVYDFRVTPDGVGPTVQHAPRSRWSRLAEPPLLRALVRDGHGVAAVWVEFRVTGSASATQTMEPVGTTDLYETRLPLPGRIGDVVEYRIEARDIASTPHVTSSPSSGWYSLQLERDLLENAEVEEPMWTHRSLAFDRPDEWHRELVRPISDHWSWKVGPTNRTGVIAGSQDAVLESPAIQVFPGGKLEFTHQYAFLRDEFTGLEALDGGIVQWQDVDRDGPGDKWWLLDPDAGYPYTLSYTTDASLRAWPAYGGTVALPERETFTFTPLVVNRTIRLRFRVSTSSPQARWPALDGWIIDDIDIDPGPPPSPVTLEAVAAARTEAGVQLAWAAAGAAPGDVFVVSRLEVDAEGAPAPPPGSSFEAIARLDAAPERSAYEFVDTAARADLAYLYRVALWSGGVEITAQEATVGAVRRFVLHPNVPNPFNPSTRIAFEIPAHGRVRLSVIDVRGRLVRTLIDAERDAGRQDLTWDGTDARGRGIASGVYILRLENAGRSASRRLVLAR